MTLTIQTLSRRPICAADRDLGWASQTLWPPIITRRCWNHPTNNARQELARRLGIDRYTQSGPAILTNSSSFVLHAHCEENPNVTWPIVRLGHALIIRQVQVSKLTQRASRAVVSTMSLMASGRRHADSLCLVLLSFSISFHGCV